MPSRPISPALPDLETSARLIGQSIAQEGPPLSGRPVAIDLSGVARLNGDELARLVGLHNLLAGTGRRLALRNVGPAAYEPLAAAGLDTMFDVQPAA